MGLYNMIVLITLAIIYQNQFAQAGICNGRRTVIEIRIPKRTDVSVKYPTQVEPVTFVPYPKTQSNPNGQCYRCQDSTCRMCNNNIQNTPVMSSPSRTVTNIIIDITGKKPDLPPKKETKDYRKDDTLIVLQDKNAASSDSEAETHGKGDTSATSATSSSTSNNDVIADLAESPQGNGKSNTQNIFVADDAESYAKSSANAVVDPISSQTPETSAPAEQVQPNSSPPQSKQVSKAISIEVDVPLHDQLHPILPEKQSNSIQQTAPANSTEECVEPTEQSVESNPPVVSPNSPKQGELSESSAPEQPVNIPSIEQTKPIQSAPTDLQPTANQPTPSSSEEPSLPQLPSLPISSTTLPPLTLPPITLPSNTPSLNTLDQTLNNANNQLNNDNNNNQLADGLGDLGAPKNNIGDNANSSATAVAVSEATSG